MPNHLALSARIVKAAYMEYTVQCPLGDMFVIDRVTANPRPLGSSVWISFANTGLTVVRG